MRAIKQSTDVVQLVRRVTVHGRSQSVTLRQRQSQCRHAGRTELSHDEADNVPWFVEIRGRLAAKRFRPTPPTVRSPPTDENAAGRRPPVTSVGNLARRFRLYCKKW